VPDPETLSTRKESQEAGSSGAVAEEMEGVAIGPVWLRWDMERRSALSAWLDIDAPETENRTHAFAWLWTDLPLPGKL